MSGVTRSEQGGFSMSVHALERTEDFGRKWPILGAIRNWFEMLAAARECGAAVDLGKRPSDQALMTLGIDPKQFDKIQL
jgi:hypothetical protein